MREKLVMLLMAAALCACSVATMAPKVEYAQACDPANKGNKVSVDGFLQVTEKILCYKAMSIERNCTFKLADRINIVGKEIVLNIREGKGNGMVETRETGKTSPPSTVFGPGDIKIRLSDGTEITPQLDIATPITVSGEMHLTSGDNPICAIYADAVLKR